MIKIHCQRRSFKKKYFCWLIGELKSAKLNVKDGKGLFDLGAGELQ